MTPQEFKAWFDGFTENVDKQPTQKQWARIKERVAEIDGKPITERVYIDRYINYPPVWYHHRPASTSLQNGFGCAPAFASNTVGLNTVGLNTVGSVAWDSENAMFSLGKQETESYAV